MFGAEPGRVRPAIPLQRVTRKSGRFLAILWHRDGTEYPLCYDCAITYSPMADSLDVTTVLIETTGGSPRAADRLFSLLYNELRERAAGLLRRESPGHTLRSTELVHELYMRLADQTRCRWQDRAHFLAVASQVMRRILIDHARRRGSLKRGAGRVKVTLDDELVIGTEGTDQVLRTLDDALRLLAEQHPLAARVVEMRFFGGLTHEECACVLGFSPRTASRYWEFAQAWLYREMAE
jgi:RNA polymerase sigma factor (TIGR02999 family)